VADYIAAVFCLALNRNSGRLFWHRLWDGNKTSLKIQRQRLNTSISGECIHIGRQINAFGIAVIAVDQNLR